MKPDDASRRCIHKTRKIVARRHWVDTDQWASEAAAHRRFAKNVWRKCAMHPHESYREGRAVAIYESAGALMRHLPLNLQSDGPFEGY